MVSAEKLPDVCVGECVVIVLCFFEASAGIRAEVFRLHLLESACDLLETLVFQHFLHELFAVFVVFFNRSRVAFFGREQFLHLERHQAACHEQEVARLGKIRFGILVHPLQKVVCDFCNGDLVERHFLFLDEIDKQVHRAVKRADFDFVIFLFKNIGINH